MRSIPSGFVLTIHGVCSEELDARAQSAWEIIQSIVDSEGWLAADDNLQQFNDLLTEALTTQSADVDQVYDEAASLIGGNWPTLEEPRDLALRKAMADAEIDRLGREARHVQLTEALSTPRYAAAGAHWRKALDFATADPVDHPNAIKEAVASLEALSQVVIGKTGLTLGGAVKELRSRKLLPAGADAVLEGLWTFANAIPGARHGGGTPPSAEEREWDFAKQIAEAGVRLLLQIDAT